MRVRHLCSRDTCMCHWKSWLSFRWVCRSIRIHEWLWNTLFADQANNSRLYVGLPHLKTQLLCEWLRLIWETGKTVCTEPVGGVEILKDGLLWEIYILKSATKGRWECRRQEVESGSELRATAENTSSVVNSLQPEHGTATRKQNRA